MSEWTEIGTIDDIPPLGSRTIKTGDGDIAIFRTSDDRIFAIEDHCPHKGGPLSQGIVHGGRVTCPLHNWTIDLETGQAVEPDEGCVRRYPLRIEDGVIFLDLKPR